MYFNFRWIWSNILHMVPFEFNLNHLVLLLIMACWPVPKLNIGSDKPVSCKVESGTIPSTFGTQLL